MIYLSLFLTFLKIGAVAFGGGYAIISFIRDECLVKGWLTEAELLNFIAIAESTPGPIAVNMATFVGSSQGGLLGAFLATLGVILPAFLIIILVVTIFTKLLKYPAVKATLASIKPAIVSLIVATAVIMFLSVVFGLNGLGSSVYFDYKALIVFAAICLISIGYKMLKKKAFSPIILIVISGALGILLYGI